MKNNKNELNDESLDKVTGGVVIVDGGTGFESVYFHAKYRVEGIEHTNKFKGYLHIEDAVNDIITMCRNCNFELIEIWYKSPYSVHDTLWHI